MCSSSLGPLNYTHTFLPRKGFSLSDAQDAYSAYYSFGLTPVKCFPNSFRPIHGEVVSDGFDAESEAGWDDFNLAVRANRRLSTLAFDTFADYKHWASQGTNDTIPAVVHPDSKIGVWFHNTDWQPMNFVEQGFRIINTGLLPAPPSEVGGTEVVWLNTPLAAPPISLLYPPSASVEPKPFEYGDDVIPLKGYLSFSVPRPQPYMENGLLDDCAKVAFTGEPKIGKSRLTLYLAFCLATGEPFLDYEIIRTARVLYVQFEVAEPRFQDRITGLSEAFNLPPDTNVPLYFRSVNGIRLDSDYGIETLRRYIRNCKPDIVFLDPLYKIHGLEENSASDMQTNLYDRLDQIIYEHRVSFVITHHVNKMKDAKGWLRVRGSGQLPAWVDSLVSMDKPSVQSDVIEVVGLLRSGEGFAKSIKFNDNHSVVMMGDQTAMEIFVAELLINKPNLSRKQMAAQTAKAFATTVSEVNSFFDRMEEKGYVFP